ncbi:hypothetical protein QBC45DRAFT_426681 [Copromyces sp. CBS 386.78]|nr:hypothetical protein QBC45DRAFT_426681 [Copromyces sp. CBS 386.78]
MVCCFVALIHIWLISITTVCRSQAEPDCRLNIAGTWMKRCMRRDDTRCACRSRAACRQRAFPLAACRLLPASFHFGSKSPTSSDRLHPNPPLPPFSSRKHH